NRCLGPARDPGRRSRVRIAGAPLLLARHLIETQRCEQAAASLSRKQTRLLLLLEVLFSRDFPMLRRKLHEVAGWLVEKRFEQTTKPPEREHASSHLLEITCTWKRRNRSWLGAREPRAT